jgi:aldehyde dehydrogenase
MMGAQASLVQKEKIMSYLKLGKEEGAELLTGGDQNMLEGFIGRILYSTNDIQGHNKMRIFKIFGPVLAVTTFKTTEEAIAIANDTMYGLGAGLWTRDAHEIYQVPRAIQAEVYMLIQPPAPYKSGSTDDVASWALSSKQNNFAKLGYLF